MSKGRRISILQNQRYQRIVLALTVASDVAGLSQTRIADALGLQQPDISKVESFQRELTITEMLDWLDLVHLDIASLTGGKLV